MGFGVACTLWLQFIYNNEMTEIMLTIVTAFASYLVADQLADASGVLAVVTLGKQVLLAGQHRCMTDLPMLFSCSPELHDAGLWMTARGKHHISRHVMHPLRVVW